MTMERCADFESYFREKVGKSYHEIERKMCDVNVDDITRRFEDSGCIVVFEGRIVSHYYSVNTEGAEGVAFLNGFFGLDGLEIRTGSSGSFSRLRKMEDDSGKKIYMAETRIYDVNISGFAASHMDRGVVFDEDQYNYIMGMHRTHASITLREIEIKRRLCCISQDLPKIEYCLDVIIEPLAIAPYLEIEISDSDAPLFEDLIAGIKKLGLDTDDFLRISGKNLIQMARDSRKK
jgi:hypothetical protein